MAKDDLGLNCKLNGKTGPLKNCMAYFETMQGTA